MQLETLLHATALSNFALAFDKYTRHYDKSKLPRMTYPGEFYLLQAGEVGVGLAKAAQLVIKLGVPGDQVVVVQTTVDAGELQAHPRRGTGRFVQRNFIKVDRLLEAGPAGDLLPLSIEEALARALRLLNPQMRSYAELAPRTLSVLPIARACQAKCMFCFSEASVSADIAPSLAFLQRAEAVCQAAKARGAQRFVITGGGEPGLLKHAAMLELIAAGRRHFDKVVLITNGVHLARLDPASRRQRLLDYAAAGLGVLSVSRHQADPAENARIMGLDTHTERILASRAAPEDRQRLEGLRLRLICVLQKGGVQDEETLATYLDWAAGQGVRELCFKELYVSTTLESSYAGKPENQWSLENQVPLSTLTEFLARHGFTVAHRLPWGAPVLTGLWRGQPLAIAAYTEPSLFWERSTGIARSWNLMADAVCLASLEDPASEVMPGIAPSKRIFKVSKL